MKYESTIGATWRSIFRKMLWVSVIFVEIVAVLVAFKAAEENGQHGNADMGSFYGVLILGTVLNGIIHSVWGCIAYMFDDIAANRAATLAILEKLEQMEKSEKADSAKSRPTHSYSAAPYLPKKPRTIAERMQENEKAPAPETWICNDCGTTNLSIADFCKDCGKYK